MYTPAENPAQTSDLTPLIIPHCLSLSLLVLWMWVALLTACTLAAPQSTPADFAIYLVRGAVPDRPVDLSQLELESTPFLSVDDILTYTWETHEIELTGAARQRVAKLEIPVTTGVPFVVCVGAERIYAGAFWISYSSMSHDGIVIDTLPAQAGNPTIRLQLGYPESPQLFSGEDLRRDARIRQSLEVAGKLR